MRVRLARWKSSAGRAEYVAAYEEAMSLWPVPYESLEVPTPFGPTHVVISGPPQAPPVLLLHAAFNIGAIQWLPNAARLARRHRIHAVDFVGAPGMGTQTRPILSPEHFVSWLTGLLDELEIGRASLIGSSQGGWMALNLAVRAPDRCGRLVLLAPAASFVPFRLGVILTLRFGPNLPPWTARPTMRAIFGRRYRPDERLVKLLAAGLKVFRYQDDALFPQVFGDEDLKAVKVRTLVMVGDREFIYDPRAALERAARLMPDVETELVADGGHLFHMEQAERTDARILRFLADEPQAVLGESAGPGPSP